MNYKWHSDGPRYALSLYPGIKLALAWLLRSSEAYGVPEGRLNTNDEHGKSSTRSWHFTRDFVHVYHQILSNCM